MKKTLIAITVFLSLILCMGIAANAADTKNYIAPERTTVPKIDGFGNDKAWEGAFELTLSSKTAAANGGYVLKKNTSVGAVAKISAIWSNASAGAGLYFKWVVTDPTHSFAVDILSNQYNSMDGVQIVLDPLYRRLVQVKNCAMCFTFIPYTSTSGVGQVATGYDEATGACSSSAWWEHWWYCGKVASTGVKLASSLVAKADTDTDGCDRVWNISGYTIEAFIPFTALEINGDMPNAVAGKTTLGIGFMLVDYNYDNEKFENIGTEASQVLINLSTDFGNGRDRIGNPRYYNTLCLGDAKGNFTQQPTDNGFASLNEYVEEVTNAYLTTAKADYTETSIAALEAALTKVSTVSTDSTEDQINAVKDEISSAVDLLIKTADESVVIYIQKVRKIIEDGNTGLYTADSWAVVQAAYDKALVFETTPDTADAKAAMDELKAAIAALVAADGEVSDVKDTTELDKAISSVANLVETNYTAETWKTFSEALAAAKTIQTNPENYAQTAIDDATTTLIDATNALATIKADDDADAPSLLWLWIVIAVVVVAAVVVVIIFVTKKKPVDTTKKN